MKKLQWIIVYLNLWRIIPVYYLSSLTKEKAKIKMDIDSWINCSLPIEKANHSRIINFGHCIVFKKELRNILQTRLHRNPITFIICRILFSPLKTLYINIPTEKIGCGFYFQHGFSTIVNAKSIGDNCHINQQVTVGAKGDGSPIIKNNVKISAGAIVIGDITINDNAVIGAGAVVTKDVPENAIVAGVPAKVIKYKD